jgi:hypothetical protein
VKSLGFSGKKKIDTQVFNPISALDRMPRQEVLGLMAPP